MMSIHAAGPEPGAETIEYVTGASSLGEILVARSARGVCAVLIDAESDALRRDLRRRFPGASLVEGGRELEELAGRISAFMENPALGLELPLDPRGTEFQQEVWRALREIPAGETVSYTELARRIGRPRSVRAVAQACGANALAVIVPCHRVVRSDGGLSGYRWGIERKRALLAVEASA
jgi:AraC family transcriptional regulator of adaptative response/methylated-DNA-[protein]-cysteine methyltransferase